jgi:hypothetical protein
MIAGAGAIATALVLSPAALAEPAPVPPPAPAPAMPNIPFMNQLAGLPAVAPQLIQGLASAFTGGGGQSTLPVDPIAAPPVASASLNLPQVPGATALPAAAAAVPAVAGAQNLMPDALASLMPAGTPLAGLLPQAPAATAGVPAAPGVPASSPADAAAQSLVPMFLPVSALP